MMDFLLLHRINETDEHPGLMLACLFAALVVGCCLNGLLP